MAIDRRLVSSHFPYLPIVLRVRQRSLQLDALIDTGFDGDLVVPHDTFAGEQPDALLPYRLADGTTVVVDAFVEVVELGDLGGYTAVIAGLGSECLIGRGIIDKLRLTLDHGRQVIAEP